MGFIIQYKKEKLKDFILYFKHNQDLTFERFILCQLFLA